MSAPQQDAYGYNPRGELAPYLPSGVSSVLDVGCAGGGFAETLRRKYGDQVRLVGIEAVESAAQLAREHFPEVITGYFPDDLTPNARFDLITFNDVLEHLVDPWSALAATRRYLTPGGRVLASIPNIQYAPALDAIAAGRFDYTEVGTFDRTHLRWFTRKSCLDLFAGAGFEVTQIAGINSVWHVEWLAKATDSASLTARLRRKTTSWARHRRLRETPDLEWLQFVVVGRMLPDRPA